MNRRSIAASNGRGDSIAAWPRGAKRRALDQSWQLDRMGRCCRAMQHGHRAALERVAARKYRQPRARQLSRSAAGHHVSGRPARSRRHSVPACRSAQAHSRAHRGRASSSRSASVTCGAREPGRAEATKFFGIVRRRRRVVRHDDRRVLVAVAELQADGAEHAADLLHQLWPNSCRAARGPRRCRPRSRRSRSRNLPCDKMKARRVVDVARADRLSLIVVAGKQLSARPSPASRRRASSRDRPRRRCRCSCRVLRSARADARRRRQGTLGPWSIAPPPGCAASRC